MKLSIVSYLDQAATAEIRKLQETLSELTGSKAALTSWQPHITVGDGIVVDDNELDQLEAEVVRVAQSFQSFSQTISGFGGMHDRPIGVGEVSTPYVLWVDVMTSRSLSDLVAAVRSGVTEHHPKWYHMPNPYLPHVTLAFRDLDKEGYERGRDYLRGKAFELSSRIDHIALVEKLESADVERVRIELGCALYG